MSTGVVVLLGVVAAIITALLLARPVAPQAGPDGLRRRPAPEFAVKSLSAAERVRCAAQDENAQAPRSPRLPAQRIAAHTRAD